MESIKGKCPFHFIVDTDHTIFHGINCDWQKSMRNKECEKCGWNPAVSMERLNKTKERLKPNGKDM